MNTVPFSKKDQLQLTITDIAFGGLGIAKIKSDDKEFVVFVENTVPGDEVMAECTKIKKSHAFARLLRRVKDSPLRIKPRCRHFGVCGGCTFQYLDYAAQLHAKAQQVKNSIERLGGIRNSAILPIIGCENPWLYRNKMEYSFGILPDGASALGLHIRERFADIFNLQECFLQSEQSVTIVKTAQQWMREKSLPPYNPFTKTGLLKSLIIREGKNTGEIMVNLITNSDEPFHESESFIMVLNEKHAITSLFWTETKIARGFKTQQTEHHLAGKPMITETLSINPTLSLSFEIHPQAFFQTNTKQAEILYEKIIEMAEPAQSDIVYDLFCGTGTIGMCFARSVSHVYGIDINEWAIKNAEKNARYNQLTNITFLCEDAGKAISEKKYPWPRSAKQGGQKPTIIILDPPRAGVAEKSLRKIMELAAQKIIYVSCNPTTFARDCKMLSEKYTLKTVQPIDMFPQTYHVETVALFTFN